MNKISLGVLVCLVSWQGICQAKGLSFHPVEPVDSVPFFEIKDVSQQALSEALELHNLIYDLSQVGTDIDQLSTATTSRSLNEKKLQALEVCSVKKMSKQFKNPQAVWDKMKQTYDEKTKDLTLQVNAAEPLDEEKQKAYERYMVDGVMTDYIAAELLAPWQLGQEILLDVYANQDKWGERTSPTASSFGLWEDQKYQFNQDWDKFYTELNRRVGVPVGGRPKIDDAIRYDYAREEVIQKAHEEYLNELKKKRSGAVATLPAEFRKAPMPPRPLPPKDEIMIYLQSDDVTKQVYPSLPEPWQKYAKNQFKDINPSGEMSRDFLGGLQLKAEAKNSAKQTNRLVAYSSLKQNLDTSKQIESVLDEHVSKINEKLKRRVQEYIPLEAQANLADDQTRNSVIAKLKTIFEDKLKEAEEEFSKRVETEERTFDFKEESIDAIPALANLKTTNPEAYALLNEKMPSSVYQQDKNLLTALQKDKNCQVFLNEMNAGDVQRLLAENTSTQALLDARSEWEKTLGVGQEIEIDDTCLNGGILAE